MISLPGPIDYQLPQAPFSGIALVGEAPGADEVKQNQPFVGRSGQLLNKVIEQAGLTRAHLLIANTFRYQPPGNKVDHFFLSQRAAKLAGVELDMSKPKFGSAYVQAQCSGEIDEMVAVLKKYRPRAIVAVGRTPLWALTGLNGLLAQRGKWLENILIPEIPVIATYHPSFIIRGNWHLQDEMAADLRQAAQLAQQQAA